MPFARWEADLTRTCLLLFGPPGVGKGTQAVLLAAALGVPHVVMSDLLRASADVIEKRAGVDLAREMAQGRPLPDDVVVAVLLDRIMEADCRNGVLVDGFPYTVGQAAGFTDGLRAHGRSRVRAVYLNASESVLLRRIANRRSGATVCDALPGSRTDDAPALARRRISTYRTRIGDVLDYFRRDDALYEIIAECPISELHHELRAMVGPLFGQAGGSTFIEGESERL